MGQKKLVFAAISLSLLAACAEQTDSSAGSRGYLEPCATTADCAGDNECHYGVCTHSCSVGCTGDATCATEVDLCLPPSIASTLDAGVAAADASVATADARTTHADDDASTILSADAAVALPPSLVPACTSPADFNSEAVSLVGFEREFQTCSSRANYARMQWLVKRDGTVHAVVTAGANARVTRGVGYIGTYYATFIGGAWSVSDANVGIDSAEIVTLIETPGSGVAAVMRDFECLNVLSCSTWLVKLVHNTRMEVIAPDLFGVVPSMDNGWADATDPHILHAEYLPSGHYRIVAVRSYMPTEWPYSNDLPGALLTLDVAPDGTVSRTEIELHSPTLGRLDRITGLSNLAFNADNSVSFVVADSEGHFVYFRDTLAPHAMSVGVDLALSESADAQKALMIRDSAGDNFSVLYEKCAVAGTDGCATRALVKEHVVASAGTGEGGTVIHTYDAATSTFGSVMDDLRYADTDDILLELEYWPEEDGSIDLTPRILRSSGGTYTEQAWPVPALTLDSSIPVRQRGTHLVVQNGVVYGAMQFVTVEGGTCTFFPAVYFRGCH